MIAWAIICVIVISAITWKNGGPGAAMASVVFILMLLVAGRMILSPVLNYWSKKLNKTLQFVENKLGK